MARLLPDPGGVPFHYWSSHAHVRDYVEQATDGTSCPAIDYNTYSRVLSWCQEPYASDQPEYAGGLTVRDKLKVVSDVLASRLKLPSPASDKAIILAQAVPVPALGPLLDGLKAHKEHAHPFIASIALHLHESGEKAKAEQDAKNKTDAEKAKWDLWCGLYGKSAVDWHGLPKPDEMGWGYWLGQDVGAEEWWEVAPKQDGDDKSEAKG